MRSAVARLLAMNLAVGRVFAWTNEPDHRGRPQCAPTMMKRARSLFQQGCEQILSLLTIQGDAEEIGVARVRVLFIMRRVGLSQIQKHIPRGMPGKQFFVTGLRGVDFKGIGPRAAAAFQKCCRHTGRIKPAPRIIFREGKKELIDFGQLRAKRIPPITIAVVENRASTQNLLHTVGVFADHADNHVGKLVKLECLVYHRTYCHVTGIILGIVNRNSLWQRHRLVRASTRFQFGRRRELTPAETRKRPVYGDTQFIVPLGSEVAAGSSLCPFIAQRASCYTSLEVRSMAAIPSRRVSSGERINAAEPSGHLQDALRQRGIRVTRQRRVILQVMDSADQHLDVDQILERAQKIDSEVHLVTVYRTIDLLKKEGLIDELDLLHLRGDRHYYETHGPRDHIHVACLRCGKVREFESRLYEQLKDQIARDCDIQVTVSRTEVGGICNDCLAASKK